MRRFSSFFFVGSLIGCGSHALTDLKDSKSKSELVYSCHYENTVRDIKIVSDTEIFKNGDKYSATQKLKYSEKQTETKEFGADEVHMRLDRDLPQAALEQLEEQGVDPKIIKQTNSLTTYSLGSKTKQGLFGVSYITLSDKTGKKLRDFTYNRHDGKKNIFTPCTQAH